MRKLPKAVLAGMACLVVAGTAVAASRDMHSMNVSMPDGTVAHILYHGDVAPRVSLDPARTEMPVLKGFDWPLTSFDRLSAELDRQATIMFRQAADLSKAPWRDGGTLQNPASISSPHGALMEYYESTTTTSDGSCTRTVQMTSNGPNRAPKVNASVSGNCPTDGRQQEPATSASWSSTATSGGPPRVSGVPVPSGRT